MGDHQDGPLVAFEIAFQPVHHLAVDVVGGLVEDEHLRLGGQRAGQCDPPLLSAGKLPDGLVIVGQPQLGQDALALVLVGLLHHLGLLGAGLVDGDAGHHLLQDSGLGRKLRVLWQVGHPHPTGAGDGAAVGEVDPGHHLEQGGLAGAVDANETDFIPLTDGERAAVEQLPVAVALGDFFCV